MESGRLSVDIPDSELRWTLKRVAVAERVTLRDLVSRILLTWLGEQGYGPPEHTTGERHSTKTHAPTETERGF